MDSYTEKIENNKELENCNFSKCCLMILVVFGHSIAFWTGRWFTQDPIIQANYLGVLYEWINSFHIFTFTLISGYIFRFLKVEKNRYQSFSKFVGNKAKRLLIPYVFVCVVWIIPISCAFLDYSSLGQLVKAFAFAISPGQLWFLFMLFDVFIMAFFLTPIFERSIKVGCVICLFLYLVGLAGSMLLPNCFQIWTSLQYLLFFWIGMMLRKSGTSRVKLIPVWIWIGIDVALFVIWKLLPQDGLVFKLMKQGVSLLLHIVGSLGAYVLLQLLAEKFNWKDSKTFSFLTNRTMPVFLFHQQIIYVLIFCLNGRLNPIIHSIINFCISGLAALIISSVLLKYKWTRFLIGEKTYDSKN